MALRPLPVRDCQPDSLAAARQHACLTLVADLRDWLDEVEPRLIGAARTAGVTWQQLAGVLRVGDRRAAQRRASRVSAAIGRYWD